MKVVIRVDDDLTLGKVVLVARQSLGWSRRKLAEASGKCESTIINVERRTTVRDERSGLELLKAMDLDPDGLKAVPEGEPNPYLDQALAKYPEEIVRFVQNHEFALPPVRSVPEQPSPEEEDEDSADSETEEDGVPVISVDPPPARKKKAGELTPGKAVAKARKCLGWSRIRLAKEAGKTPATISRLENDRSDRNESTFLTVLKSMGLDPIRLRECPEGKEGTYLAQALTKFPENVVRYCRTYEPRNFVFPPIVDAGQEIKEVPEIKETAGTEENGGDPAGIPAAGEDPDLSKIPDPLQWNPDPDDSFADLFHQSGFVLPGLNGGSFAVPEKYQPTSPISFAIPLLGHGMDSMLPYGSLLYVARTDKVKAGETGVFQLADGNIVCRKVTTRKGRLITLSGGFGEVPRESVLRTLGRVAGFCPPGRYFPNAFCRAD